MLGTYEYRERAPLEVPMTVFGGRSDEIAPPADLRGWRAHTAAGCRFTYFPGDHFFLHDAAGEILTAVADRVGAAGARRGRPGADRMTPRADTVVVEVEERNPMANPVALITGGSRGIGRATAVQLAKDGYDIALCYASDATAAQDLEKELVGLGRGVYVRRADVSDPAQVATLVAAAQDALGPITALVASAAVVRDTPLAFMEHEDWDAVLRVNLDGVYHACRAVIEEMMSRRQGAIVTLSSLAGLRGNAGQTNYAASKAGIIGFTKALAQEVGRHGIRANVVTPGFIATDQLTRLPENLMEHAMGHIALRRVGRRRTWRTSSRSCCRRAYITGASSHHGDRVNLFPWIDVACQFRQPELPTTLDGAVLHRGGPVDGRARHDRGEHRHSVRPGRPRHVRHQPAVDHRGVHAGLRRAAAVRRPGRGPRRSQAHLPRRAGRLRRGVGHRWRRGQRRDADRRPGPAGRLGCAALARRAGDGHGHVHRSHRARQGVRHLQRRRRRRRARSA